MSDAQKAAQEIIRTINGGDDIDTYIRHIRLHVDEDADGKTIWESNPEAVALIAAIIDKHMC